MPKTAQDGATSAEDQLVREGDIAGDYLERHPTNQMATPCAAFPKGVFSESSHLSPVKFALCGF